MRTTLRSLIVLNVFAFMLSGCTAVDRPGLLEPPYEAVTSVRGEGLLPWVEGREQVVVTDDGVAHAAENRMEAIGRDVWRMSVNGFWVVDVVRGEDGGVNIVREVEPSQERRVAYDPPLPLIPAELRLEEPATFTSGVELYNDNSGALEATGTCTATYTLLGVKSRVQGGDTEQAVVIRTERRYKLPLVSVEMRLESAYVQGEGPVAGRTVRVVKLLGLLPIMREQSVVRAEEY